MFHKRFQNHSQQLISLFFLHSLRLNDKIEPCHRLMNFANLWFEMGLCAAPCTYPALTESISVFAQFTGCWCSFSGGTHLLVWMWDWRTDWSLQTGMGCSIEHPWAHLMLSTTAGSFLRKAFFHMKQTHLPSTSCVPPHAACLQSRCLSITGKQHCWNLWAFGKAEGGGMGREAHGVERRWPARSVPCIVLFS